MNKENSRKWLIEEGANLLGMLTSPGTVFYVDSGASGKANDSYHGLSWEQPFATIDYAIGKCTASKGDIILVAPRHAETLVSATGMVFDVAGVTVIGLKAGGLMPTITLGTATSATIAVSAANVTIKGLKIVSALADIAAGITAAATADGLVVEDCIIKDGGTAILELVIGVSLAAGLTDAVIKNNFFNTFPAGSSTASAIKAVGAADRLRIVGNTILGDWNTAAIDAVSAASIDVYIAENVINNLDAGAGLAISCKSDTTGAVVRNLLHGGKDGTAPIAAAACLVAENYGTNAEGASGIILPAVDS